MLSYELEIRWVLTLEDGYASPIGEVVPTVWKARRFFTRKAAEDFARSRGLKAHPLEVSLSLSQKDPPNVD